MRSERLHAIRRPTVAASGWRPRRRRGRARLPIVLAALALALVAVPSSAAAAASATGGAAPPDAVGAAHAAPGPRRVVTLAPHLTELVYAAGAGDRLVGTVDTSDWPPPARAIARVGDVTRLDAERLLALRPDLVLAWADGTPAEQLALLRRLGLRVASLSQRRLDDVPASLEQLGALFGTRAVADAEAARLRADLAALRARYAGRRELAVFYQVWATPLMTLGGTQVVSEMLEVCGARNVFGETRESALAVAEESVYARDPDVLVLAGPAAEAAAWRERWTRRPRLRALERGAVVQVEPDLVARMGPRLVAGTAQLCARLDAARRP